MVNVEHRRKIRRYLFLFSDTGGGHRASAQAVKDEIHRQHVDDVIIDMVDVFVEMDRWPFSRFPKYYPSVFGLNGVPWAVAYRLLDSPLASTTLSRIVWPFSRRALCRVLRKHPADVIVSFHSMPNYSLFLARKLLGMHQPLASVTLDLVTAHASWFARGADLYFVPTDRAKARALRCGIRQENVEVVGMPTRRSFAQAATLTQRDARLALGVPLETPLVLVVGGGEGMGPYADVVRSIVARGPNARIVAIAGRNATLAKELLAIQGPAPLQVEGFVNNMETWMRASNILLTKAGPNTIFEAFLAGLPMVLYAALPGQEEGNVSHVIRNGAGIWAPKPALAADAVVGLLADPQKQQSMAHKSQALARPQATEHIAQRLWGLGDQN